MTVVAGEIYTEMLRYAYALSTIRWPHMLAYATVPVLGATVVIAARQLRAVRRPRPRLVAPLSLPHELP
jgi:hypothetical protein